MALEEITGINKYPFMRRRAFDVLSFARDVEERFQNFKDPYKLTIPDIQNPIFANVEPSTSKTKEETDIVIEHGTTTLGFKYQGGVLVAADSRTSQGSYIASNITKKVMQINKFLLVTMAGSAADCLYWDRALIVEGRLYELRNGERMSVSAATKIMSDVGRRYKGMGLSMGMIFAGFDKTGPQLYHIDHTGDRNTGDKFVVGSGWVHASGLLDTEYRWDLTDDEAQELAKRAICNATFRDSFSGGIIRVFRMTPDGFLHISNQDCAELRDEYEKLKFETTKNKECKPRSSLM